MRKLIAYNFLTLNGYYKGKNGDLSWNRHGEEEHEFALGNVRMGNTILFGRITYEMMAGYWPTPEAIKNDPIMAEGMNSAEKIVFSKTLEKAGWDNTKIIKDNIEDEIKKMKQLPGRDMTILGSGSIISRFAEMGLIDEYQLMINPVAIGNGTPILRGVKYSLDLKLIHCKTFKSGVVLLYYRPVES